MSKRLVQLLGALLLLVAVVLPWAVVAQRARSVEMTGPVSLGELRPEMIIVPGGTFQMGSPGGEDGRGAEERQHKVTVSRFAISRTEVTQGQFAAVMGTRPFETSECRGAGVGAHHPAMCVTWREAVEYCNRLSDIEGLTPVYAIEGDEVQWPNREANGYRLPTEAEWEYAARAGTTARYLIGASEQDLDQVGWYGRNSGKATHPVRQRDPNPWGLYDVLGNVWEWVWDWYADYEPARGRRGRVETSPQQNPRGPDGGVIRVIRGGSWHFVPQRARVAYRAWLEPSDRGDYLGFRLARSLPSGN